MNLLLAGRHVSPLCLYCFFSLGLIFRFFTPQRGDMFTDQSEILQGGADSPLLPDKFHLGFYNFSKLRDSVFLHFPLFQYWRRFELSECQLICSFVLCACSGGNLCPFPSSSQSQTLLLPVHGAPPHKSIYGVSRALTVGPGGVRPPNALWCIFS